VSIVFGTGHRPEDSGGLGYADMYELIHAAIRNHHNYVEVAVTGMAAGFDLAWGMAAIERGITVWAVKPWSGHQPRREDRNLYRWVERHADRTVDIVEQQQYPGPWCYQKRNKWMVDNSDEGFALWNGKKEGGTYNCLKYAHEVNKPVLNLLGIEWT
jgi:uncharacterized phage-like protein YoqJ